MRIQVVKYTRTDKYFKFDFNIYLKIIDFELVPINKATQIKTDWDESGNDLFPLDRMKSKEISLFVHHNSELREYFEIETYGNEFDPFKSE